MMTLFCSPKAFRGESEFNQLNALRSWRALGKEIDILVFGDSIGSEEAAQSVSATHISKVPTSPSGAPLFNFMAAYTQSRGRYDLQLYANADILFDKSILLAMETTASKRERFLLVGERIDLPEGAVLDVRKLDWRQAVETLLADGSAASHGPTGVDYFGYRRNTWAHLPPVFMGRAMCDQALLHHCLGNRIPVVDATPVIFAVHQFHGYSHVKGGSSEVFAGGERAAMAKTHGLWHSVPTIADADWTLTASGELVSTQRRGRRLRELELRMRYRWGMGRLALVLRAMSRLSGRRTLDDDYLAREHAHSPRGVSRDDAHSEVSGPPSDSRTS